MDDAVQYLKIWGGGCPIFAIHKNKIATKFKCFVVSDDTVKVVICAHVNVHGQPILIKFTCFVYTICKLLFYL